MKFKKLASLALAGAMSLSLAVPAFASNSNSTIISGGYEEPEISVTVTPTAQAFINPLGLDVVAAGVTLSGHQIISVPMSIKNGSAMDLQVDASVTATVASTSNMRFVSTTTGGSGATKTVFAYLQAATTTVTGDSQTDAATIESDIADAYAAWEASDYDADTDVLVNSALATSKTNLIVVRAADTSGSAPVYKSGSIAMVRLAGDCVTSPTTGAWTETVVDNDGNVTAGDAFTVNVAYTFKPAAITKYDVTVTMSGDNTADAHADVAKAAEGDTVTITVTDLGSSAKATITVTDSTNTAVSTTPTNGEVSTVNDTVTFTMPAGAVAVAVAFS